MRGLYLAAVLALSVAGLGAAPALADTGPATGCAVNTPRGSVALPSSACDHVPALSGADCVLTTPAVTVTLPPEACEHGPRRVDGAAGPPSPGAAGACQITTDEGRVIQLPEPACEHLPATVAPGAQPTQSDCTLLTPSGRAVRLPARACQYLPSLAEAGVVPAASISGAPTTAPAGNDLTRDDSCDAFVRYVRLVDRQLTRAGR